MLKALGLNSLKVQCFQAIGFSNVNPHPYTEAHEMESRAKKDYERYGSATGSLIGRQGLTTIL